MTGCMKCVLCVCATGLHDTEAVTSIISSHVALGLVINELNETKLNESSNVKHWNIFLKFRHQNPGRNIIKSCCRTTGLACNSLWAYIQYLNKLYYHFQKNERPEIETRSKALIRNIFNSKVTHESTITINRRALKSKYG